jgi:5-methylcytosine-specific restriction endonuclease McrA
MGVPGKRTVSRSGYRDYINSQAWRDKRQKYWQSNLEKDCYCCGTSRRPGMHLHHRTYKNLGAERLMDLVPVCPDCHDEIHRLHDSDTSWKRKGLWAATQHVRKQYRRQGRRGKPKRE